MAVSIRLRREGTKNRPYYKVVVADSRSPRDGKFIEIIGTYDPKVQGDNSTMKMDRAEHWLSCGAQPSDTVRSLIKKNKARATEAPAEGEEEAAPAKAKPAKKAAAAKAAPAQPAPVETAAEEPAAQETAAEEPSASAEPAPEASAPAADEAPAEETPAP